MKINSGGQGRLNGIQHIKRQKLFGRIVRFLLITFAAVWMLLEEWVWDKILAVMAYVGRLKVINRFETFLARQHQYLLLTFFIVPFLIMIPAKVYGLYLMTSGHVLRGVTIFVVAKGLITALVTRLFLISKDKLLRIRSFARFYFWFADKKEWLYSEVRKLPAWQVARMWIVQVKARLHSLRSKDL
jgi:hypothetical protein